MIGIQRILLTVAALAPLATAASIQVRLTTSLTSYDTEPGTPFRTVVIAPYVEHGKVVLPTGTVVIGSVSRVARVGMGMVRERALMDLDFHTYELPDGRRFPIKARLRRVDNAREQVTDKGTIKGILAANGPQSLLGGVWHSPRPELLQRGFIGLTGAGGRIFTEYSMGPVGAAGMFAVRCAMFRMPEPEIRLPAGAEMLLEPTGLPEDAPTFELPEPAAVPVGLQLWLSSQDAAITKPGGVKVKDIINVALIGSREALTQAFDHAGWTEADGWTTRAVSRAYEAYNSQSGYASAPVSKLLYRDREPDIVFEKTFNTISKRHHIRLWRTEFAGLTVWLGAATHDIGVSFNSAAMSFDHKISPRIDLERSKALNDLLFAGCLEPVGYVDRERLARDGAEKGDIFTDGRLAVAYLKDGCSEPADTPDLKNPRPPLTRLARMMRRILLEGRQYAIRGNAYYWGYRAFAMNRERRRDQAQALLD